MTGPEAGNWVDFDNEKKLSGQVLSTIKEHFGLKPGQVYRKAIEIIKHYDGEHYLDEAPKQKPNGSAGVPAVNRHAAQITFYWSERQPAAGSVIETVYWPARKLGKLPPAAFSSIDGDPDLVFSPMATNFDTNQGYPTMISRFRYPD